MLFRIRIATCRKYRGRENLNLNPQPLLIDHITFTNRKSDNTMFATQQFVLRKRKNTTTTSTTMASEDAEYYGKGKQIRNHCDQIYIVVLYTGCSITGWGYRIVPSTSYLCSGGDPFYCPTAPTLFKIKAFLMKLLIILYSQNDKIQFYFHEWLHIFAYFSFYFALIVVKHPLCIVISCCFYYYWFCWCAGRL